MKNSKFFCGGGCPPPQTLSLLDRGHPFPNPYPREATTVDYSVKQYIDESFPAQLEKSGNLVLWKVVTLQLTFVTVH